MYALSERASEVFAQVDPITTDAKADPMARFIACLVGAAAAIYCDEPGRVLVYLAQ
jgi:hypothetical protein